MKQIGIIGCGWFGLPLAQAFIKQGHQVIGSKRSLEGCKQLASLGVTAYPLDLNQDSFADEINGVLDCEFLVINIPPGLRKKAGKPESRYLEQLQKLLTLIGPRHYQKLVFISTTGVYPAKMDCSEPLSEADAAPHSDSSETLLKAEALFAQITNSCIVRFAGLVGPNRHPGRFLAGKASLSGANVAVNLVHLDDCIAAVMQIINAEHRANNCVNSTTEIYNVVAPIHPKKGEFYAFASAHLGLAAPEFNQQLMPTKVISGALLCQQFGFVYQYPDPFKMLYAC
ncbi:SDR family oxidoreductase [Shewanella sp.]|uniref:SDR family oxidoreductase n=1 Tax=Shewanella sp. TaxID=50422 RepID=UPI00405455AE